MSWLIPIFGLAVVLTMLWELIASTPAVEEEP
jgi:hypothetical protein